MNKSRSEREESESFNSKEVCDRKVGSSENTISFSFSRRDPILEERAPYYKIVRRVTRYRIWKPLY